MLIPSLIVFSMLAVLSSTLVAYCEWPSHLTLPPTLPSAIGGFIWRVDRPRLLTVRSLVGLPVAPASPLCLRLPRDGGSAYPALGGSSVSLRVSTEAFLKAEVSQPTRRWPSPRFYYSTTRVSQISWISWIRRLSWMSRITLIRQIGQVG